MLVLRYQSLIISCAFQFLYCSFYSSVCDAFFHLLSDTLQNTLFKNNLKPSHRVVSINKLVSSCSRIYTFSDNLQNKRAEHNQQGESIFVQDVSMGRKEKKKKQNSLIHSFTQKLMYEELTMCQAHFFQRKALALIILLDAHGNRGLRE